MFRMAPRTLYSRVAAGDFKGGSQPPLSYVHLKMRGART